MSVRFSASEEHEPMAATMLTNRSAPSVTVVPILIYEDVGQAIDWLCPTDMPFGQRQYTVQDHAGHWWTFSQHVADVAPEAWGATPAA